mgnify:CR=1 FL=1
MIPYRQGDIVLLPFPFTDFSSFKQRPALVISSDDFNFSQNDIVVVAISSHIPSKFGKNDFLIGKENPEKFGLPKTSLIKLGKIITVDQRLVRKSIGKLPKNEFKKIVKKIQEILGLE